MALMAPMPAAADTPYTCGTGTLRNVEAVSEMIPTHKRTEITTRTNRRGERTSIPARW